MMTEKIRAALDRAWRATVIFALVVGASGVLFVEWVPVVVIVAVCFAAIVGSAMLVLCDEGG